MIITYNLLEMYFLRWRHGWRTTAGYEQPSIILKELPCLQYLDNCKLIYIHIVFYGLLNLLRTNIPMSPSPHLMWVNSKPTTVNDEQFVQWYTQEHIPDIIENGVALKATLYRETFDFPGSSREHHERSWLAMDQKSKNSRPYLAVYQTKVPEALKTPEFLKLRRTSDIMPVEEILDSGEFDGRYYNLIQDYDPDHIGDGTYTVNLHESLILSALYSATKVHRYGRSRSKRRGRL
jgi:hypothetical protein